ncbi:MAG: efflux RND transporter periplasmic adaptor subunit [Myxacorys chilensis ATA2-1-KO14]|jgi:multidrug efflux pump subunit AcrA (membrane-fusion protein)|nr:efflux RND transporter periplasmic adaptor subunit [Myxacorys chilensis ATA2-1-KO14]
MNGEETNQKLTVQTPTEVDIPSSKQGTPPPRWRRFLLPALIGLAIVGGVGWIVFNRLILPMIMASQMKAQPTPVPLANPQTATIEDSSDYAANLDSRQSVTLQPRVSGQISAIYVRPGDRVEAGKPILQIDAAEQRAQVASRQAATQTAAAEIESAQADVNNANETLQSLVARRETAVANVQLNQREYDRYLELQRQGATSRQVLDQRLNALQTARAALREAEAELQAQRSAINRAKTTVLRNQRAFEQTQANVAEGQAQLQYYTITAPFSGTVSDIPVKVGDTVSNSTQLFNITQNEQLDIQIQIPLERSSALRLGLPVKLLDDQSREIQTGRISFIAPNVDPATQSVQVKARFENGADKFRTSQFVRARVVWSKRPGILVPTTAISRLGGRDFMFVAAPFKESGCTAPAQSPSGPAAEVSPDQLVAAQKPIQLGKIVGNNQEVLEGIRESDRIVTAGILQLQNCTPISDGAQAQ